MGAEARGQFSHARHQSVCRRIGWKNPSSSTAARWLAATAERRKCTEPGIPRGKFPTRLGYVKHTAISSPALRIRAWEDSSDDAALVSKQQLFPPVTRMKVRGSARFLPRGLCVGRFNELCLPGSCTIYRIRNCVAQGLNYTLKCSTAAPRWALNLLCLLALLWLHPGGHWASSHCYYDVYNWEGSIIDGQLWVRLNITSCIIWTRPRYRPATAQCAWCSQCGHWSRKDNRLRLGWVMLAVS